MKRGIQYLKFAAAAVLLLSGCGRETALLPAEGFAAQAKLSTNVIHVGDPVTLTLIARHSTGSVVRFPAIGNGKTVMVRNRASENRPIADNILESKETYQLTSFRVGDWPITTNVTACTFPDGTEKKQALNELILHVESSLNPTNTVILSDIKGIVRPPLRFPPKLWVSLLIVLLALLAGFLTIAFLRKPRTVRQTTPPQPPEVIARQALSALRGKAWRPEPFFTELSLILRTYLENRFKLNAPELTTEELTRTMSFDARLEPEQQQTLRNFMIQADLVKFARADAEQEVMQNAFTTVEHFVEQTKEPPAEPQKGSRK